MPPKHKFSADEIVSAALTVVRQNSADAMTARAVAEQLGASPKVIFGLFTGMDDLRSAVFVEAQALYGRYISQEIEQKKYPPYKASGMAYIRFAREEPALFRWLFMRDRSTETQEATAEYPMILELIMQLVSRVLTDISQGARARIAEAE